MDAVLYETRGPVAWVRFNRPHGLNAGDRQFAEDLQAVADRLTDRDAEDFLEEVRAALRACFDAEEHHAAMAAWRRRTEPS